MNKISLKIRLNYHQRLSA